MLRAMLVGLMRSVTIGAPPLALALAFASPAAADDDPPQVKERMESEPPRTWATLRGGLTNDPSVLHVCAELIPLEGELNARGHAWRTGLSIEACGNGSGFLFQTPAPEIAHFRAKWKLWAFDTAWGWFEPIASVGFAELQTGADAPGFSFFGPGPGGNSTAGPEVGSSMRYRLSLGYGLELLAEGGLAVASFAYAPMLRTPADPIQTSLTLTAGLGW